jgi:hypothetical protein
MPQYLQPLVQVELDVLFEGGPDETAPPAAASSVGHGTTDSATRREEEYVDVWVDLGDDGEADVEVEVEGFERNISA